MRLIDRFRRIINRPKSVLLLITIGGLFLAVNYFIVLPKRFINKRLNLQKPSPSSFTNQSIAKDKHAHAFKQSVLVPTRLTSLSENETENLETENLFDNSTYENSIHADEYDPFQQTFKEENHIFKNNLFKFQCTNIRVRRAQKRNKNLIVFENFITGKENMECHESITYTTHGDYRYLDNLIPLVNRWNGPVSVAIYSPGDDLSKTLKVISFIRDCSSHLIKRLVTFHIFFEVSHLPETLLASSELRFQWLDTLYEKERWKDCEENPGRLFKKRKTYRIGKKLLYPVNIARNIARSSATTYYVMSSDIELYPSSVLISAFFKMLKKEARNNDRVTVHTKQVYVLPIFEVEKGISPPMTKTELSQLLETGAAIPFHSHICKECHLVPKYDEWKKIPKMPNTSMRIFHKAKRKPPFQFWEPIYIGTNYEPRYDERLSWEGLRDKMTQGYIMCAMEYDFLILDNAFLVHRPGIKRQTHKITQTVLRQDRLINLRIKAEFFRRFGKHDGCFL